LKNNNAPNRFYSLDVLRGLASLCVVLAHWGEFYGFNKAHTPISSDNPLISSVLIWFDTFGSNAVDLFFCISGFVFYWLYSSNIYQSKISFTKFAVLRLSRLYPLHLLTLLLVTAIHLYATSLHQTEIGNDNAYHFLLNLFFVSAWGFNNSLSFNIPAWSVSTEIFLYGMFFILCWFTPKKLFLLLTLSIAGHFIVMKFNYFIGRGMESFFMGGCTLVIYEHIKNNNNWPMLNWYLPIITVVLWCVMLLLTSDYLPVSSFYSSGIVQKMLSNSVTFIMFPITILSLVLLETKNHGLGKKLAKLGDISYSTYLLHFPLQLIFLNIWLTFALNPAWFYSASFIVAFFVVLILVSLLSYHYFELPMQKWLRQCFKKYQSKQRLHAYPTTILPLR
jgi:peptidoglycan/LPS O-acetylase OafA/YrhL